MFPSKALQLRDQITDELAKQLNVPVGYAVRSMYCGVDLDLTRGTQDLINAAVAGLQAHISDCLEVDYEGYEVISVESSVETCSSKLAKLTIKATIAYPK